MGQTLKMNEVLAATNIRDFKGLAIVEDDPSTRIPTFIERRLHELGVYDMAPSTNKPSGFYVNWTTVTGLIIVISAIAGLWYFTWQTANEAGYQRGKVESEKLRLEKELEATNKRLFVIEEKQKMEKSETK